MKKQKKEKILEAIVGGVDRYQDNKPFEHRVRFTMCYPDKDESHYGTGCYMMMELLDVKGFEPQYYDVRYVGTSEIKKVAKIVAKQFWGENLKYWGENFKCYEAV